MIQSTSILDWLLVLDLVYVYDSNTICIQLLLLLIILDSIVIMVLEYDFKLLFTSVDQHSQ